MNRRNMLQTAAVGMGMSVVGGIAAATESPAQAAKQSSHIESRDGTQLFFKDWGSGRPIVFVHSWAANSDMWQYQMTPLSSDARCVAYDRRGHGRSSQPGFGYDYDTLADDLAAVIDELDIGDAVLVGHSMGAGEIVRYLSRHGTKRVSRIVLLAPVTPFLLQTAGNPDGIPATVFASFRNAWCQDFPKWLSDNGAPFFVEETSQPMRQWLRDLASQTCLKALVECSKTFSEADFRAELGGINVPALVIQGDKDASAPLELTGRRTAQLIPHAELKVYEGAPHGLFVTHLARLNADLAAFARV
jgi:non-heme chloroperoxidase